MEPSLRQKKLNLALTSILGTVSLGVVMPVYAADNDTSTSMDAIVILGDKIKKNLDDAVTAVSVLSEDDVDASSGTTDVNDIVTSVPNVTTAGFGSVSIRGIDGTGAATGGYALYNGARARVSTIVDGDAQSWFGYNFTPSKLWDVHQVEVMRGPQSTNQGTNSIGGALVVATNDPSYESEGAVRAGLESYDNGNVKYNAAVMSSGALIDDELAYRIAVDGESGDGYINYDQDNSELDDSPDLSYSKNVNTRLKLLWEPKAIPKLTAKLTVVNQEYEGEYTNWANDSASGYDSQTYTLSNDDGYYVRLQDSYNRSIATDLDYELSDSLTNSLHVSRGKSYISFEQYDTSLDVDSESNVTTIENRLTYQTPRSDFSGVIGLYYSKNETDTAVSTYYTRDAEITTTALYGEGTYNLTPSLKLVSGARVENERNQAILSYSTTGSDESNTVLLPKIGLVYDLTESDILSASIRKGYNAGGYAYNWSTYEYYYYDEESVIAYEIALKNKFESSELKTSLFYNDFSNYQALDTDGYFTNINDSRTYGIEVEGVMWASDSLKLKASLGLMKTEVISDDTAYSGAELPNAAGTNISLGFTKFASENVSFDANVTYVGEYYSDLENTESQKAGDYGIIDTSINYVLNDFSVNVYVKNLTNEDVITYIRSDDWASVGQTRTIGMNVNYKW